jgi:hypothetical protein
MDASLELQNLLEACAKYRSGEINISTLQGAAAFAASMILDPARNKLRSFINSAADELELIQYTSKDMRRDALRVVSGLEEGLKALASDQSA